MINKLEVGERISRLRKKEGYSQAEFSELLNVTPQAVSKWETGISLPDIEVLLNISWMLKTTINEILDPDYYMEEVLGIERGYFFLNKVLRCPKCGEKLSLDTVHDQSLAYKCQNGHDVSIVDGVVDFRTREIPGEQWSLSYRNYEEYLHEHHWKGNPNYLRGLNEHDIIWEEVEKRHPKVILDMACGTGQGMKHIIKKITWPVTIIMVDLSHRILKWDKQFYSTEWKNPYVDMVYLACDGAHLPLMDQSVDLVFSNGGYESMQAKMMDGFREAYRVLKKDGCTVYNKSVIEDSNSSNSKKWMSLLLNSLESNEIGYWKDHLIDIEQWNNRCKATGFVNNTVTKIYGELPVPDTTIFPYENEMAQWMALYVVTSSKA